MKRSDDRQMMELVRARFEKYTDPAKRNDPVWVNGGIATFVFELLDELLEDSKP